MNNNKEVVENSTESIHSQVGEDLMLNSSVKSESSFEWKIPTRARCRRRQRFMAAQAKVEAEAKEAEEEQEVSMPDSDMGSKELNGFENEGVRVQSPNKPLDKKLKSKVEDDDNSSVGGDGSSGGDAVQDDKRHQCPVSLEGFASGQGLGGHKRVHMLNDGASKGNNPSAPKLRPCLDLNLPPPETDEDLTSIEDLSISSSDEELFE